MTFLTQCRNQVVRILSFCNIVYVGILIVTVTLTNSVFAQENASFKIDHYTMSIGHDGVKRETSYSENLYRNGSQLIYSRITPINARKKDAHGRDHRHFDSALSPQLVSLNKNGEVNFAFLDTDNKIRIEVSKSDFNSVGFSGSWAGSYSLVDPAIFKTMVKKGPGQPINTIWYEQVNDKGITRILWDEKNKIALEIEVTSKDGLIKKRSTSKLIKFDDSYPLFTSAKSFEMKVIADYRD